MQQAEITSLLNQLDGSGSDAEWHAVRQLRGLSDLPEHLLEHYAKAKRFGARSACVYHCIRYAKESQAAFSLGIKAIGDRSAVVRYRAAMLLAVAQRPEAIPALETMRAYHQGTQSAKDAEAAIEALVRGDPNLFVDRENSGMVTLSVG